MVLLMDHLVKWFAVRESMHDVENKVFANEEEDYLFGCFNRASDFINFPFPRKLPVVKPGKNSEENKIHNNCVKEYLTDSFNNFLSPFTIVAFFVPWPWTFFNFVLFYKTKFKPIQNVVKQIDQNDCLRSLSKRIENDSLSVSQFHSRWQSFARCVTFIKLLQRHSLHDSILVNIWRYTRKFVWHN